jgi:hypothetical protein
MPRNPSIGCFSNDAKVVIYFGYVCFGASVCVCRDMYILVYLDLDLHVSVYVYVDVMYRCIFISAVSCVGIKHFAGSWKPWICLV